MWCDGARAYLAEAKRQFLVISTVTLRDLHNPWCGVHVRGGVFKVTWRKLTSSPAYRRHTFTWQIFQVICLCCRWLFLCTLFSGSWIVIYHDPVDGGGFICTDKSWNVDTFTVYFYVHTIFLATSLCVFQPANFVCIHLADVMLAKLLLKITHENFSKNLSMKPRLFW